MAVVSSIAYATQYDEKDLVGGWELVSCQGTYPGFTTDPHEGLSYDWVHLIVSEFEHLYLGTVDSSTQLNGTTGKLMKGTFFTGGLFYPGNLNLNLPGISDPDDYLDSLYEIAVPVSDFCITNENKFHITTPYGWDYRFIIESLDSQRMILKSYDGKCTVTYQRVPGTNKINTINPDTVDAEEDYYNLNGIRQNKEQKGINIIRKGNKAVKKLNTKE